MDVPRQPGPIHDLSTGPVDDATPDHLRGRRFSPLSTGPM